MILCKHLPIKTGFVAGKGSAPHRSITLKELDHRTGKAGPGGPAHPTPDGDGCSSDTLGRMLTPTLRARLASTARVAGDIRRKPHVAGNMTPPGDAKMAAAAHAGCSESGCLCSTEPVLGPSGIQPTRLKPIGPQRDVTQLVLNWHWNPICCRGDQARMSPVRSSNACESVGPQSDFAPSPRGAGS